jgi:hypothetical protein
MPKAYDLTNITFGKLKVLHKTTKDASGDKWLWKCVCSCGNFVEVRSSSLVKKGGTKSCGCLSKKHFVDLTGLKNNRLTAIKHLGKNNYSNHIYECLCECGKRLNIEGSDFKTGRIKSCGYCTKSINSANKLPYGEMLYNTLYQDYQIKAKQRDIEFDIPKDIFLQEINKNCHYCNQEPSNLKKNKSKWNPEQILYSGLDRVDNNKGYLVDNIVPCCFICNQAKHRLPLEVFLAWVKRIHKNLITKEDVFREE